MEKDAIQTLEMERKAFSVGRYGKMGMYFNLNRLIWKG